MSAHQENMYFDGPNNHSFNPMAINRQPMRPFEAYGQLPPMYQADRHHEDGYRYSAEVQVQSQRRAPAADTYNNSGWGYNGPTGQAATVGRSSQVRPVQRAPIPTVSQIPSHLPRKLLIMF